MMIRDMIVLDDIGFMKTDKQFVFVIDGSIYGPWNNKDWKKVIKKLEEEK